MRRVFKQEPMQKVLVVLSRLNTEHCRLQCVEGGIIVAQSVAA